MTDPGAPFWVPSATLQRHLNRLASGDPGVDWLTHVRRRYLPARLTRTLVVGCGEGFIERALSRMPGAGEILAVDADAAALGRARRRSRVLGLPAVSHGAFDPDSEELPPGPWDAIVVHGALHHASDPEAVLRKLHDGLDRRGRLVVVDYVGPARFAYPESRIEIVRRYARLLPERLRTNPGGGGRSWSSALPDPAELSRTHPHEAAHSEALIAFADRVLRREALHPGGGGLLHPLLSGRASRFGEDPAGDERVLSVLCAAEEELAADGRLPHAFAIFVGRRREGDSR